MTMQNLFLKKFAQFATFRNLCTSNDKTNRNILKKLRQS